MTDKFGIGARLASCKAKWELTVVRALEGGYSSNVFLCVMPDARQVVLKLSATQQEAQWEVSAITAWASTSDRAVSILDTDVETGAILLRLLEPATPLPPDNAAATIAVVADLCRHLHITPVADFPHLMERYTAFEQRTIANGHHEQEVLGRTEPPGLRLLPKAKATALKLSVTTTVPVLLHGDLTDKNILLDKGRYVVIDPIPMIGDPCSDVGFFAAYHPPASKALDCAAGLAAELSYDGDRCERWTAVWLAHQACEAWRADSAELYDLARDPAIERLLACR